MGMLRRLTCSVLGHDPQIERRINVLDPRDGQAGRANIERCVRCQRRRIDTPYLRHVWTG